MALGRNLPFFAFILVKLSHFVRSVNVFFILTGRIISHIMGDIIRM